jgi:hypothetical protein
MTRRTKLAEADVLKALYGGVRSNATTGTSRDWRVMVLSKIHAGLHQAPAEI